MIAEEKHRLIEELSEAKTREPFTPFALVMRDGTRREVHDRWHIGFSEVGSYVVVLRRNQTHEMLLWSDVTAVQTLELAGS